MQIRLCKTSLDKHVGRPENLLRPSFFFFFPCISTNELKSKPPNKAKENKEKRLRATRFTTCILFSIQSPKEGTLSIQNISSNFN